MNTAADHDEKLERLIGDTLRDQPVRHAPGTLALRVLAEIEHRATTPWYRMTFARWPRAAQLVFLVTCAVVVKFAVDASIWLTHGLDAVRVVTGMASVAVSMKTLGNITAWGLNNIPLWIYGSIAVIAAMYAALFGISAAAYRTLYANRQGE